jgi:CRISPR-associated endonuclease/helicase Cas3
LMSATLGTRAAARYFEQPVPGYEEAVELDYPLLRHADAGRSGVHPVHAEATDYTKEVAVDTAAIADDPEAIAQRALDAARTGARVLVIRNVVKDCIATQEALEALCGDGDDVLFCVDGVPTAHHSRFAAPDRKRLDRQIERDFGKESTRSGVIAIATQTVEQSLDLDADLMLTDLCPIDVLLQRIGRLHRHKRRARPAGFEEARVEVLVPELRDLGESITQSGFANASHGLGTVYEDLRVLEATWRQLEENTRWVIPTMNRRLVEAATHPEKLTAIVDEFGDAWVRHQTHIRGVESGDRTKAKIALIERDKLFEKASYAEENLDSHLKTRLGLDDRRVGFEEPFKGPFGELIYEFSIAEHMCRGVDPEAEWAEDVAVDDGVCRFRFDDIHFIYDRHGLDTDDP